MDNNKSPHILNTSATLLGLCFVVLTSITVMKLREASIIDELTTVAIVLFMTSCILSFLSMRNNAKPLPRLEYFADMVFLAGLACLFLTAMFISFNLIA